MWKSRKHEISGSIEVMTHATAGAVVWLMAKNTTAAMRNESGVSRLV